MSRMCWGSWITKRRRSGDSRLLERTGSSFSIQRHDEALCRGAARASREAASARRQTWTIIGTPVMSASGFPGSRVEASRAGIITIGWEGAARVTIWSVTGLGGDRAATTCPVRAIAGSVIIELSRGADFGLLAPNGAAWDRAGGERKGRRCRPSSGTRSLDRCSPR